MSGGKSRQTLIALNIALASAMLSFAAAHYLTFIASLENIAADIRLGHAPPKPQHPDIIVAAITEDTLSQFRYRSPVDREFLAGLLRALEKKGARAIALDVLLDQPTEPEKDALLHAALREIRTPMAISYTHTPSVVDADQLAYMREFVPAHLRAWANLATDPFDGVVRWINPGEDDADTPPSLPRKIAQRVGVDTPAVQTNIAWRARPDRDTPAFRTYPAHAVALLPDDWIRGRIVMIGGVLSLTDRHRTPYAVIRDDDDARMPGIVVQAHATAHLLAGAKSDRMSLAGRFALTFVFAAIGVGVGLLKRGLVVSFIVGGTLVGAYWLGSIFGYAYGLPLTPLVAPTLASALSLWMMDTTIGRAERRARQFVQSAFSRYVSPAVVEKLIDNPEALAIAGQRHDATFIFTDITDFTTLAEGLSAERLSAMLNDYLDGACRIILAHGGTIDKFIGDAIMTIFNAPIETPDHIQKGLDCALALEAYAENFRAQQHAKGISLGPTRIGIHTGTATIGNFGSSQRMDFTALGDVVNTASRIEGANKYFGTRMCASEAVVRGVSHGHFRPIGPVQLKGKSDTVRLFEPLTEEQARLPQNRAYADVFPLIEAGDIEACRRIEALARQYPTDRLLSFHLKRAEQGMLGQPIVLDDK